MFNIEMMMIILFEVDVKINDTWRYMKHKVQCLAGIAVFNYVRCIPLYHMMLFYTNLMFDLSSMADIPYLVGKLLFILETLLYILLWLQEPFSDSATYISSLQPTGYLSLPLFDPFYDMCVYVWVHGCIALGIFWNRACILSIIFVLSGPVPLK